MKFLKGEGVLNWKTRLTEKILAAGPLAAGLVEDIHGPHAAGAKPTGVPETQDACSSSVSAGVRPVD
jgi:hypothetical protein